MLINPTNIIASGRTHNIFVKKMVEVLRSQGQIEPLQVKHYVGNVYITYTQDPHGAEIVEAAKILGWDTLLCTLADNGKYIY